MSHNLCAVSTLSRGSEQTFSCYMYDTVLGGSGSHSQWVFATDPEATWPW